MCALQMLAPGPENIPVKTLHNSLQVLACI